MEFVRFFPGEFSTIEPSGKPFFASSVVLLSHLLNIPKSREKENPLRSLDLKAYILVDETGPEKDLLFFTIFHERRKPLISLHFLRPVLRYRTDLNIPTLSCPWRAATM